MYLMGVHWGLSDIRMLLKQLDETLAYACIFLQNTCCCSNKLLVWGALFYGHSWFSHMLCGADCGSLPRLMGLAASNVV